VPTPKPGQECVPGQEKWCDGSTYCGWGVTECDVNGKWKHSCLEPSDGRRPNTKCACYNYYFNPACCERPDCLVPSGTKGQICADGTGKLCEPCNPEKPNCTEGKCIIDLNNMSYCGRSCSANQPCPAGYDCKFVFLGAGSGSYNQCVPKSSSCY